MHAGKKKYSDMSHNKDNSAISTVVDIVLAALYTWCICSASANAMEFKIDKAIFYLFPLAAVLFFVFLLWNRWTVLSGGMILVVLALYFAVWARSTIIYFLSYSQKLYNWLYNYIQYWGTPDLDYGKILYMFLCVVVGFLSWIFINKRFNFYVLAIGGITLFATQYSFDFLNFMPAFYIYVFVLMLLYIKFIFYGKVPSYQVDDSDVRHIGKGLFIINFIPVAAIALSVALILPYSQNTIFTWKWLDRTLNIAYEKAYDFVSGIREGKIFSLADTGFSENASLLGGAVSLNESSVLKVSTPSRVYLKGRVYDVYTGRGWLNSENRFYDFTGIDTSEIMEFAFANAYINIVNGLPLDNENFEILENISVKYLSSGMRSVFTPQRMFEFESFNKDIGISFNPHIGILGNKRFRKDDEYKLSSYLLKRSGYVEKALKTSNKGFYDRLVDNTSKENRLLRRRGMVAYELLNNVHALKENAAQIYSKYLNIPEALPHRVIDLSKEIASGADNDYETAKRIEKYLSSNFPYTLNPGRTPRDVDFVDYFLFENKKGYCTYYASAMVIMCRAVGIPARYVEGYTLPEKEDPKGGYIVTNRQAHAWVEVYFEGFGWIEFEPTAAFHDPFYSGNERASELLNIFEPEFLYDERYKDYIKGLPGMDGYQWYFPEESQDRNEDTPQSFVIKWYCWVGAIIMLLLIYALSRYLISYSFYAKAVKKGSRYIILYYYYNIVGLFKYFGRQRRDDETLLEYGERLEKHIYKGEFSIVKAMGIFSKALYSQQECTKNETDYVSAFCNFMHKEMKTTYGSLKYFMYMLQTLLFLRINNSRQAIFKI